MTKKIKPFQLGADQLARKLSGQAEENRKYFEDVLKRKLRQYLQKLLRKPVDAEILSSHEKLFKDMLSEVPVGTSLFFILSGNQQVGILTLSDSFISHFETMMMGGNRAPTDEGRESTRFDLIVMSQVLKAIEVSCAEALKEVECEKNIQMSDWISDTKLVSLKHPNMTLALTRFVVNSGAMGGEMTLGLNLEVFKA